MEDVQSGIDNTNRNGKQRVSIIPLPKIGPPLKGASKPPREAIILLVASPPTPSFAQRFAAPVEETPAPQLETTPEVGQPAAHSVIQPAVPRNVSHTAVPSHTPSIPPSEFLSNERLIARTLAIIGAVLIVMGAFSLTHYYIDLFGALARTILAAIIGALLALASFWMRHRQLFAPTWSSTFAASGAILVTDILTITFHYGWWPEWACILALIPLIVVYLAVARLWKVEYLLVTLGCIFAVATVAFQIQSNVVQFFPGTLVGVLVLALSFQTHWITSKYAGTSLITVGVIMGDWAADFNQAHSPMTAAFILLALVIVLAVTHFDTQETNAVFYCNGIFLSIGLLLISWTLTVYAWNAWLAFFCTLAWIAFAFFSQHHNAAISETLATILLPINLIVAYYHTVEGAIPSRASIPWIFLVLFTAMIVWMTERKEHWTAWVTWSLVSIYMVSPIHSSVMLRRPEWLVTPDAIFIACLLLVVLTAGLWCRQGMIDLPKPVGFFHGLLGLHYSTVAIVTLTTAIFTAVFGVTALRFGYFLGHAIVSVLWILASGWLLLGKTKLSQRAVLASGITFALAGSAKLILFDMSNLPGIPRVIALLVSGVSLLVIATRRAHSMRQQNQYNAAIAPVQHSNSVVVQSTSQEGMR